MIRLTKMARIYLLEDINDNQYIGSTTTTLGKRLSTHRRDKKISNYCSSSKLNLEYCSMFLLEECSSEKDERKAREAYWISQYPECVNVRKLQGRKIQRYCDMTPEQKERKRISNQGWYHRNKDEINKRRREKYALKSKELKSNI